MKKFILVFIVVLLSGCKGSNAPGNTPPVINLTQAKELLYDKTFDSTRGIHQTEVLYGDQIIGDVIRNDYIYPDQDDLTTRLSTLLLYNHESHQVVATKSIYPTSIEQVFNQDNDVNLIQYEVKESSNWADEQVLKLLHPDFGELYECHTTTNEYNSEEQAIKSHGLVDYLLKGIDEKANILIKENHVLFSMEDEHHYTKEIHFMIDENQITQIAINYLDSHGQVFYEINYEENVPDIKQAYHRVYTSYNNSEAQDYDLQMNQMKIDELSKSQYTKQYIEDTLSQYLAFDDSTHWGEFIFKYGEKLSAIHCYYYNFTGGGEKFETEYQFDPVNKKVDYYRLAIPKLNDEADNLMMEYYCAGKYSNNIISAMDYNKLAKEFDNSALYWSVNTSPIVSFYDFKTTQFISDRVNSLYKEILSTSFEENRIEIVASIANDQYIKTVFTIKNNRIYEILESTYSDVSLKHLDTIHFYTSWIPNYDQMKKRCNGLIHGGTLEDTFEYNYYKDLMK